MDKIMSIDILKEVEADPCLQAMRSFQEFYSGSPLDPKLKAPIDVQCAAKLEEDERLGDCAGRVSPPGHIIGCAKQIKKMHNTRRLL